MEHFNGDDGEKETMVANVMVREKRLGCKWMVSKVPNKSDEQGHKWMVREKKRDKDHIMKGIPWSFYMNMVVLNNEAKCGGKGKK